MILAGSQGTRLSLKDITSWVNDRHVENSEKKLTRERVGWVILKRLRLKTERTREGYLIPATEPGKLARLYKKVWDRTGREPRSRNFGTCLSYPRIKFTKFTSSQGRK